MEETGSSQRRKYTLADEIREDAIPADDSEMGVDSPFSGTGSGSSRTPVLKPDIPSSLHPAKAEDNPPTIITSGRSSQLPADVSPPLHPIERAKLLRGEHLDHFVLEDFVGIGGMGIVFRAQDTLLNRTVAIKVLAGEQARDAEVRKRFRNEAQSAARLDHEHIARVYYIGEAAGLPYIVFEFIDGINVRDLVNRLGPLPVGDAIRYTLQMAGALAHVSSRNVVHRDVKPSNILITSDGRAKMVDMGLARLHHMDRSGSDLTASGVTLGTFDYISPEQARDPRNVDTRSDIYSLGCTFYFMLTGQPPFPEGTMVQKLLQHQADAAPDPRDFNPNVPGDAVWIVRKMMAKDPNQRYQSATELIKDLMLLAGNMGLRDSGPAGLVWVPPENIQIPWWERHLPWLAPAAALLLAVVLLEFVPWLNRDTSLEAIQYELPAEFSPPPSEIPLPTPLETPEPSQLSPSTFPKASANTPPKTSINNVDNKATNSKKAESLPSIVPDPLPNNLPEPRTPSNNNPTPPIPSNNLEPRVPMTAVGTQPPATNPNVGPMPLTPPEPMAETGFVVQLRDGKQVFTTLNSAFAAARAEELQEIELRYNGPRKEKALVLDKSISLRAADGFRPVLVFEYEAGRGLDPGTHMLTLVGGQVMLQGIQLEMDVPSEVTTDRWSMFRTRGCRSLVLRDCSLTLRNTSGHLGVAFIELASTPGRDAMMSSNMQPPLEPVSIDFRNFIARGEAGLLRSFELQPVDFMAYNGYLALGKPFPLLLARGGQMPPRAESRTNISLERITALLRGGLCRLDSEAGFPPLTPNFSCRQSIFIGEHTPDRGLRREDSSALIEQVGVENVSMARQRERFLLWNCDHLAYSRFESFWRVSPTSEDPHNMTFADWQDFWLINENSPQVLESFAWKTPLPGNERSVVQISPQTFELANPNLDLGVNLSQIPTP